MLYIACPCNCFTGGPELLHQLCAEIMANGFDVKMCYYNREKKFVSWDCHGTIYEKYGTAAESLYEIINQENNYLIVPETAVKLALNCEKCNKIIYWLSVDNYYKGLQSDDDERFRKLFLYEKVFHIVQSKYAHEFCGNELHIPSDRIMYVSDYINEEYINVEDYATKKNYICYNPQKGFDVIAKLIYNYPEYCWIPLYNLSVREMIEYLSKSKVYIDFGPHPGKDRIPREAALCGCCVITNKKGSAQYKEDVPIPEKYKFDSVDDFSKIIDIINGIFLNYDMCVKDFYDYVKIIKDEKEIFENQVKIFLEQISVSNSC